MLRLSRLALLLLALAAPALAHGGAHDAPETGLGWSPDAKVVVPLLLFGLLYAIGASRLRGRSRLGRGERDKGAGLFAAGWLVLALAIASPLHEAGELSFTLHMVEHELVMLAAAWLLAESRPLPVLLWAFPQAVRSRAGTVGNSAWWSSAWRFLSDPLVATIVQAVVLVAWHMPGLFDRALASEAWHIAQHISFLASALLFWWAMANGRTGRHGLGVAALCLFATSLVGGLLGALMSFSQSPWYQGYAAMGMAPFGMTPVEDQHLAGLLMWIPGGLVHAGAALYFLYRWLVASEVANAVAAQ